MEIGSVKKFVVAFCKEYKSSLYLKFLIRSTQEEALGNEEFTAEAIGRISGAYLPSRGVVLIAASNIRNESHLEGTLKHEIIGHFGLNTLESSQKAKLLTAIKSSQKKPGVSDLWSRVSELYLGEPPSRLAEEVFALSCESEKVALIESSEAYAAFERVCIVGQRSVTPREIYSIGAYVAQKLRDKSPQVIFPKADGDQFKITQIRIMKTPSDLKKSGFRETVENLSAVVDERGDQRWEPEGK